MDILNFIIALLFFFLIFSLFTSWVVEFIAQQINLRGKFLEKKLCEAIGADWLEQLYQHPLLVHFKQDQSKPADSLNPEQVATAVASTVLPEGNESVEDAILKLPKGAFRDILSACLQSVRVNHRNDSFKDGQSEIKRLEEEVLAWLNSYNRKITQWYKTLTRKYLFFVGLAIAIGFNVDVLHVGESLWRDANLSKELAASAEIFTQENQNILPRDSVQYALVLDNAQQIFSDYQTGKVLPIGWSNESCLCNNWPSAGTLLKKLAGFVLSAFVVTLGAPFWYDALRKIIDIKSAMKPNKHRSNHA